MKARTVLFFFFLLSALIIKAQTIEVSGSISESTLWDVDTVKLVGDVSVEKGAVLSIGPGVFVEAQAYYQLTVEGSISAIGSANDTIIFTVNDTSGFWLDTNSVAGGWHGIYILGETGNTDSSFFSYCKFQYGKNYDDYGGDINGGALYVKHHGFLHINHCLFSDNMVICYVTGVDGPFGGAIFCESVNRILIDSNRFVHNRSFDQGGAIRISTNCLNTTITHNTFLNNSGYFFHDLPPPWGFAIGGGGAAVSSSSNLHSPEISNNRCFNNQGLNGIIYTSNRHAKIFNNVICNNWGCGIMDGHQMSLSKTFNNTIVNNRTRNGGILLFSKARVYNNICWGNEYFSGQEYDQIKIDDAYPVLSYNCVQFGDGGEGAVYDYPEFTAPTDGVGRKFDGESADWSLFDWSPCINAGTPDTLGLKIPDDDVDGNIRLFGNRIDMGAFENQIVWVGFPEAIPQTEVLMIYPNPASKWLTIQLNDMMNPDACQLEFYDLNGRLIDNRIKMSSEKMIQLDVSSWTKGMYFVILFSSNRMIEKRKIIIK